MAAPTKKGLDYYPRDINLMMDRKFRKPKMKYGYLAIVIYDALLELIYGDEGYYVRYSESNKDDVAWDILDRIRGKYNVESETIYEVIEMLVECELFSDYQFKQGIITSKRIQKVYYKSTVERKNVEVDKKIWFLTISEMETISSKSSILSFFINQPINEDNQPINEDNQPINSQSKVKERISPPPHAREGDISGIRLFSDKSLTECYGELKANIPWMEQFCMNIRLDYPDFTPELFYGFLDRFFRKLQNEGEIVKSPKDAMSHFANWLNIELEKLK